MKKIVKLLLVLVLTVVSVQSIKATDEGSVQKNDYIEETSQPIMVLEIDNLDESTFVSQLESQGYELTKTNTRATLEN